MHSLPSGPSAEDERRPVDWDQFTTSERVAFVRGWRAALASPAGEPRRTPEGNLRQEFENKMRSEAQTLLRNAYVTDEQVTSRSLDSLIAGARRLAEMVLAAGAAPDGEPGTRETILDVAKALRDMAAAKGGTTGTELESLADILEAAAPDGRARSDVIRALTEEDCRWIALDGAWLREMADESNLTEKQSGDLLSIAVKLDILATRSAWQKGLGATP